MGARPDGRQHLLRLGGGEHEDQVIRRLLDDLQQRVESGRGDHVRLVDDEDAVPRLRRRVERAVAQLASVVDAAVAGRVEFDDVDAARTVRGQRHAGVAHPAWRGSRALRAVQRSSQDARRRRLPTATRPREQVGVVDTAGRQRGRERFGDMLLADHVGEDCRSVLAVERHAQQATEAVTTSRTRQPFSRDSVADSSAHVARPSIASRSSGSAGERRRDPDVLVLRVFSVRERRPRLGDGDARILRQRDGALGGARQHVEADEVSALRLGPRRDLRLAEPVLEDLQHQRELRRQQLLVALHLQAHPVGVAEEPQMPQLVHLVRADGLLARVLQIPRDVAQRAGEEADAGAGERDLGRRREHQRPVRVARRLGQARARRPASRSRGSGCARRTRCPTSTGNRLRPFASGPVGGPSPRST